MLATSICVFALRAPMAPSRSAVVRMQQDQLPSSLADQLREENARLAQELAQVQDDLGIKAPKAPGFSVPTMPKMPTMATPTIPTMPAMASPTMPTFSAPPAAVDDTADRVRLAVAAGIVGVGALTVVNPLSVPLPSLSSLPSLPSLDTPAAAPADPRAAEAMAKFFPGAMSSVDVDRAIAKALYDRGYTAANTLFAASTSLFWSSRRKYHGNDAFHRFKRKAPLPGGSSVLVCSPGALL